MTKTRRVLLTECETGERRTMRVEFEAATDYEAAERMLSLALDEVRRQRMAIFMPLAFPEASPKQVRGLLQ